MTIKINKNNSVKTNILLLTTKKRTHKWLVTKKTKMCTGWGVHLKFVSSLTILRNATKFAASFTCTNIKKLVNENKKINAKLHNTMYACKPTHFIIFHQSTQNLMQNKHQLGVHF